MRIVLIIGTQQKETITNKPALRHNYILVYV